MINGAHVIVYSRDAEADRTFLKDVLGLTHADAGGGWLIFGLPPSEIAVHPGEEGTTHELYLMCEDLKVFIAEMKRAGRDCTPPADRGWGVLTSLTLPSGAKVGVYQPRHARPEPMA